MNNKPGFLNDLGDELGKFVETGVNQVKPQQKAPLASKPDQKEEIVEFLYGKGKNNKQEAPLKAEDEEKLQKYRQELKNYLHSQYYQREFNKPKPPEEKPAERVERQKIEDLQNKEKKKNSILVQRAQQKTEKYPGASG